MPLPSVILLDPQDDLPSLRGRLAAVRSAEVVVIIPRSVGLLHNPVACRLLARQVEEEGKQAHLVAEDPLVRSLARAQGLRVTSSLRGLRLSGEERQSLIASLALHLARTRWLQGTPPVVTALMTLVVLSAFLLGGIVVWFLIPSATVTLVPVTQGYEEVFEIEARRGLQGVDLAKRAVPARPLELRVEASDEREASKSEAAPKEFALGQVTFINRSAEAVAVRKGSRVATSEGRVFATTEPVTVPAGVSSIVRVAVVAEEPGSPGNVGRLTINQILDVGLASALSVLNERPTEGGSDATFPQVTQEDQERFRKALVERIREASYARIMELRREGESVYPQTVWVEVAEEHFEPVPEGERTRLRLRLKAVVKALAFSGQEVNALASRLLEEQGTGEAREVVPGSLSTRPLDAVAWDESRVSFRLYAAGKLAPRLDREQLKQRLRGMTPQEVQSYLSQRLPLAARPQVVLEPAWARALPPFPWRIDVKIQHTP